MDAAELSLSAQGSTHPYILCTEQYCPGQHSVWLDGPGGTGPVLLLSMTNSECWGSQKISRSLCSRTRSSFTGFYSGIQGDRFGLLRAELVISDSQTRAEGQFQRTSYDGLRSVRACVPASERGREDGQGRDSLTAKAFRDLTQHLGLVKVSSLLNKKPPFPDDFDSHRPSSFTRAPVC